MDAVSEAAPGTWRPDRHDTGRRPPLRWAMLIAAGPALSAGTLAVLHAGAVIVAIASMGAALGFVAASLAGLRFNRDVLHLADTARRAGWSDAEPAPRHDALAATESAREEIARLAQKLSERASLIETLLGAEEAIVERLPDPLVLLGADRSVRRANEAARTVFGTEISAVLRHPSLRAAIEHATEQALLRRTVSRRVELALGLPVSRDVLATVIGLDPALPGGGRVLVVLSDRTRERAIERTRTDFIANASHELRTPLTSLIGFIETLRGPAADDPPAQARFLDIMGEQAARMNRLIDDLLSLSRIEIVEHQAPQGRVDAVSLLTRVAAGFEPRVSARRQSLTVSSPDTLPALLADEDQIVQVLENLLDNACKYGSEGGRIEVSAAPEDSPGLPHRAGVAISVTDNGPGIARVHLPRLTERFYRAESGRPRGAAGTGLGLAIVKHIVNRHRGTLKIESEPGRGAIFKIWLPSA